MTSHVNNTPFDDKAPSLDDGETVDDNKALTLDDDKKIVKIKIEDTDKTFIVPTKFARISILINNAIDEDKNPEPEIELQKDNISYEILELVVEYMNLVEGNEPEKIKTPLRSTNLEDLTDLKYANFINNLKNEKLYQIIEIANYMNIESLLYLGCAKVGSMIKGQPLDKMTEILRIKNENKEEKEEKGNE